MTQPDAQMRGALGAGGANVVATQFLQHGRANQADEERQQYRRQRQRRKKEMRKSVAREKSRLPEAELHGFAAPERGEPAKPDREDGDEENAGKEHRHGDSEHAEAENQSRAERVRTHSAVNPGRQRNEQHDEARREYELETRWELVEPNLKRGALIDIRRAEIDLDRAAEIARKLHRPGRIEPKLVAKGGAFGLRHRLSDDLTQRIAERCPHRESDDGNDQHDEKSLAGTLQEKAQRLHVAPRSRKWW